MCIYMYVYTCVYIYSFIYIYIARCTFVYLCVHTYLCDGGHGCIVRSHCGDIHRFIYVYDVYIYIYICMYVYTNAYIHVICCIPVYICLCYTHVLAMQGMNAARVAIMVIHVDSYMCILMYMYILDMCMQSHMPVMHTYMTHTRAMEGLDVACVAIDDVADSLRISQVRRLQHTATRCNTLHHTAAHR